MKVLDWLYVITYNLFASVVEHQARGEDEM